MFHLLPFLSKACSSSVPFQPTFSGSFTTITLRVPFPAESQGNSSLTAPAYGEEVADTKVLAARFKCAQCGNKATSRTDLDSHIVQVHSPVLEVVSGQAEAGVLPTLPTVNTLTSVPEPRRQPYLNTYQRQQTFYPSSRAQQPLPQSYR